jgi:hypothetical protein
MAQEPKTMTERDTPEWKLKNSIGFQFQFYTYSGLKIEKAVDHCYEAAIKYSEQQAAELKNELQLIKKQLEIYRNQFNIK